MNKKDKTLAFMELTLWWEDGQRASNAASLAEQARPSGSGLRLPFPSCSCWFPSPLRILQCLQFPQKLLCYAPPSCPFMLLPLLGKISPFLPFQDSSTTFCLTAVVPSLLAMHLPHLSAGTSSSMLFTIAR